MPSSSIVGSYHTRSRIVAASRQLYNSAMSSRFRVKLILIACLCLSSHVALATQFVVSQIGNGDFQSIQRAIDFAAYGDTIFVNPGTYSEPIILKQGVSIIGAGAEHTTIESSYGYHPTVNATSVSSVLLQGLTIERTPSLLEAPALAADNSQLELVDCVLRGGRDATLQVSGSLTTLLLVNCSIEDPEESGLRVTHGASIDLRDTSIRDAGAHGIVLESGAASLIDCSIQYCARSGIAVDGPVALDLVNTDIAVCARYGMECHGSSEITFRGLTVEGSSFGGLAAAGNTTVTGSTSSFQGGNTAILLSEGATVALVSCAASDAESEGISISDTASIELTYCEIARCNGIGLLANTSGSVDLEHVTIAANGSHGVDLQRGTLSLDHSVVSLNDGVGIRVSSATQTSLRSQFNVVWGNGSQDYDGMPRPPSDTAQHPGFANPEAGDFSLRADSACLVAGRLTDVVGKWGDPNLASATSIDFSAAAFGGSGAPLIAGVHFNPSATQGARLYGSWRLPLGATMLEVSGSLEQSLRIRGGGRFELPISVFIPKADDASTIGISGALDGMQSWWSCWTDLSMILGALSSQLRVEYEGSTRLTRESLRLGIGDLSIHAASTRLVPGKFGAAWRHAWVTPSASWNAGASLDVLPVSRLSLASEWATEARAAGWETRIELHELGSGILAGSWEEAYASVAMRLRMHRWKLEDVQIRGALEFGWMRVGALLGVHATYGLRAEASLTVDLSRMALPPGNHPPVPQFTHFPLEPEARELIRFDASPSADPDGELDQIWWDFGDGSSAIGATVEHEYAEAGEYIVTLMVSDDDEDVTTLTQVLVLHPAQTTPIASFVWAAATAEGTRLLRPLRTGDHVLLDALASRDPDGLLVEYGWDLQSDGVFDYVGADPLLSIEPLSAGAWPVTLRVIDDSGQTDAVMRVIHVSDPKPPQAGFDVSPRLPAALDPVRFLDRSIPGDAEIASWLWDFGDGHRSRETEPVHRFSLPGAYRVRLELLDAEGHGGTVEASIQVVENPTVVPVADIWCVVIGISDYEEVEDLSYASDDARAIAQWLLDSGVPHEQIRLLTDRQEVLPNGLESSVANLVNVRAALGWLRQQALQDDLVLLHFSGHGYQGVDDGNDEVDGTDEFFVLHDTRAAAKDDTALRDDEFGRFLDRIASEHVLVFFDSCYSGGLSRSLAPGHRSETEAPDVFSDFALEGRLILSASEEGSDAFESPQLQHGVFTHFLLAGLQGEADLNADGRITAWELHEFTRQSVPPFVQQERGERQIPQMIGEGESRILLSTSQVGNEAAFSYWPEIPYAGGPVCFVNQTPLAVGTPLTKWSFGDGTTGHGASIQHVFDTEGEFAVSLTLEAGGQLHSKAETAIPVSAPAEIVAVDPNTGIALISVGSQNGVSVGDRFELASPQSASLRRLEVIELIDRTQASCSASDLPATLHPGTVLRPATTKPCPPSR